MSNDPIKDLDSQQRKVLPRIEALLRLADKGKDATDPATANEAASAAAKAQELLLAYNLDASALGVGSEDGVREEQKLKAGHRQYERDLWDAVAKLNFCLHFNSGHNKVTAYKRQRDDGSFYMERERKWEHLHRLVGKRVNVLATVNMAQYLMEAIERLVDERLRGDAAGQRWSKFNVAFRDGASDTITTKLYERRRQLIQEEEQRARDLQEAARQAGREGVSTSTAMTIGSLAQQESAENNDFANGLKPGTTAASRARWQAEKAAQAEANRMAREEHTRWCEENPEEARAQAEAQRKEQEAAEKREARNAARRKGRYNGWTKADDAREATRSAYYMGADAAKNISIDQQMGGGAKGGKLGHG